MFLEDRRRKAGVSYGVFVTQSNLFGCSGAEFAFGVFPFVGQRVGNDAGFGGEFERVLAAAVLDQLHK